MTSTSRPLRWVRTPTITGQVLYEVEKIGTFTLGFDHASYPRADDEARLHVAFGVWDGEGPCPRGTPLPHAPVINTITLVGGSFFDPQEALEFLHRPDRTWAGWIWPSRLQGRWAVDVPDRTRARVGVIVANLADEFLHQEDYRELLHAHRARHAPARAAAHRENLARVEREISEWVARRDHERKMLEGQDLLIAGAEDYPDGLVVPPWRDYQSAATVDGETFLIATVGARKAG